MRTVSKLLQIVFRMEIKLRIYGRDNRLLLAEADISGHPPHNRYKRTIFENRWPTDRPPYNNGISLLCSYVVQLSVRSRPDSCTVPPSHCSTNDNVGQIKVAQVLKEEENRLLRDYVFDNVLTQCLTVICFILSSSMRHFQTQKVDL